jgi:hypothetical protein
MYATDGAARRASSIRHRVNGHRDHGDGQQARTIIAVNAGAAWGQSVRRKSSVARVIVTSENSTR